MRGKDQRADVLFTYVNMETRIPADHPLRPIREMVETGYAPASATQNFFWTPARPIWIDKGAINTGA
jgi:hypothetical protein